LHDLIPLIINNYNNFKNYFSEYFESILKVRKILCVSNFTKTEMMDYCKKNNLLHNNFPILKAIMLPYQYRNKDRLIKSNIIHNKIKILLPGTIEPRKKQINFLKAFNKFTRNYPNISIELNTFGHLWSKDELMEQVNSSNNKIKYLGIITNKELFELYNTSDFTVYISIYEGFGCPISESLWHGTPVLTTNFGAMNEVASVGGCYCIDSRDDNEIYKAIEVLVNQPEVLKNLRKEIERADLTTWYDYGKLMLNEILTM
jgi:glycosyltransferase involved in cell wall biosynthesis